jgi:hypothetical protein
MSRTDDYKTGAFGDAEIIIIDDATERKFMAEYRRRRLQRRAGLKAGFPERIAAADVLLVWHYDEPNNEQLRGVYPATPEGAQQATELETTDNNTDSDICPIGEDIRLCRGTYIEEVKYGRNEN